ncbi:hypothetical protein [Sphingobacterium bambusae]|uniref:DUF4350 domain-containing protein n=1 Tax=Sphingobacterium bambusae TaxID=662858 RepID=A0ABW6BB98_9SPHI|nr:hypothetical protein [Sphingobacterium bambusae]WPL49162.1 hypothetical protein SCB77_01615 [Sphingobacterium bambusae]
MRQAIHKFLCILLCSICWLAETAPQQVSDQDYHYAILDPLYHAGTGPQVLFDEAHHNGVSLRGTYAAFGKLLEADGYRIASTREKISRHSLKGVSIYATVNATYDLTDWNLPARSAFSEQEIAILVSWVKSGGNLLLITDHMPCGGAISQLAAEFGINVINGFAVRIDGKPEIFSKARKTLHSSQLTENRTIDSIMCWGGTGFLVPSHAHVVSTLGADYKIYLPSDIKQMEKKRRYDSIPFITGIGLVNGAYLNFGQGRIFIYGDGAPFSAQLQGIHSEKRGINHPSATDHPQFIRNIIHWLDQGFL